MKIFQSLQFRFIIITAFILLLSLSLVSFISTHFARQTISNTTYELMNAITDSAAGKIKGETEKHLLCVVKKRAFDTIFSG